MPDTQAPYLRAGQKHVPHTHLYVSHKLVMSSRPQILKHALAGWFGCALELAKAACWQKNQPC